MYEINRFFTINSLFFTQICPEKFEILSTDLKNPRASDGYVQHNRILNLLIIFIITVAAGKILIFHLQRKKERREKEMHPCQEHAIRQSCNIIFANSFSLFISIL